MTNKDLKNALLEKLNITKQGLSYRIQQIKKKYPITTQEATYIIAQNEGMRLDKYLDIVELERIRNIIAQMPPPLGEKKPLVKAKLNVPKTIEMTFRGDITVVDPMLPYTKLNHAKEMSAIYPILYILENSMREFICKNMKEYYGDSWWDNTVSKELRNNVFQRMSEENRNKWHQRRGSRPIDYLDFIDLKYFFRKLDTYIVPGKIPSIEWITQLIDEVYKSRCVLCHMNPLDKDSITSVRLRFNQWIKQIK